jgi:hypothetical protein
MAALSIVVEVLLHAHIEISKGDNEVTEDRIVQSDTVSRRRFVLQALAGLGGIAAIPPILDRLGMLDQVLAATPDLTHDTINGLVAFIIPGPDAYSVAQGVSTPDRGGIDAGATDQFIHALNLNAAFLPALADTVATLLNQVALGVNPASGTGPFQSPFANLSFPEKVAVFSVLEGSPNFAALRNLISVIPGLLIFIAFSEAAVWDRANRKLTGTPFGWTITGFPGPAEGRADFRGFFENRRKSDA